MRTPLRLLCTLAPLALALAAGRALAGDPSQWTCDSCPFEKGTTATVDAGIGYTTDDSAKFGDYTGLDKQGAHLILNGTVRHRDDDGTYADLRASDLGLDTRSLQGDWGRAGRYELRLGYAEIPHFLADTARSPFLGAGGARLTLPAGFPAPTTAAMPLDATLQDVDLNSKRQRLDLGATVAGPDGWQFRIDARRDVRDGLQRAAGSFFSSTSQLAAPVDLTTDQLGVTAAYADRRLQASISWHASSFRNGDAALTWQNPFTPVVAGATAGQLALAPDNEFQQLLGTIGYQFTPTLRGSAEVAWGRMRQNESYLAPTLNTTLAVPALPAASLDGDVGTLDVSLRLTAAPVDRLRIAASLTHNERDNNTRSLPYPTVSTDMFVDGTTRANLPYGYTRDRAKLDADWRADRWKLAGGLDHDVIDRTFQETDKTRETTAWAKVGFQPAAGMALSMKLSRADRDNTGYASVASPTPDNPSMRKFDQADRRRDQAELRADLTIGEGVSVGLNVDVTDDDYTHSVIGLTGARGEAFGLDVAAPLGDNTQLRFYGQGERTKSSVAGSQGFAQPDWVGRIDDQVGTAGVGVTHAALEGKLELSGDLAWARSRSDTTVALGTFETPFPAMKTTRETLRLGALWHRSEKMSLLGSLSYEHYHADDWHLDGVGPATVPNLLAFGERPPAYRVGVIRFAVRYRY